MSGFRALDLSQARVLVTNDDGIGAEGLSVLREAIAPHVREVWTVAPSGGRSAASVMMSLRRSVGIERHDENAFAVDGSPADCVLVALRHLMAEKGPDLVLSGINHGANLGDDLNHSGTVGAAITAALEGIPAIALSVDHGPKGWSGTHDWRQANRRTADIVLRLAATGFARGGLYAVNFPHDPAEPDAPALVVPGGLQGRSFDLDAEGEDAVVVRHVGDRGEDVGHSDYSALRQGRIAITPVTVDRTDHAVLRALPEAF